MISGKPVYCCGCECDVHPRLTNGKEIYPHRPDLHWQPFWKCIVCGNYVGCHHKTDEPTKPLGVIPTKQLRDARQHIHKILDPLWNKARNKGARRTEIYNRIAKALSVKEFHTAEIRSVNEARKAYRVVRDLATVA